MMLQRSHGNRRVRKVSTCSTRVPIKQRAETFFALTCERKRKKKERPSVMMNGIVRSMSIRKVNMLLTSHSFRPMKWVHISPHVYGCLRSAILDYRKLLVAFHILPVLILALRDAYLCSANRITGKERIFLLVNDLSTLSFFLFSRRVRLHRSSLENITSLS